MKNGSITATLKLRNNGSVSANLPQSSLKKNRFGSKVMLCVWRNFEGVGVSLGVCSYRACSRCWPLFSTTGTSSWNFDPGLVNRNRVLLQRNNTKPHTARAPLTKIQELGGIELPPHPAYSPNREPSGYRLFRSMAHLVRGRNFENWSCRSGSHRILHIKNQRMVP